MVYGIRHIVHAVYTRILAKPMVSGIPSSGASEPESRILMSMWSLGPQKELAASKGHPSPHPVDSLPIHFITYMDSGLDIPETATLEYFLIGP